MAFRVGDEVMVTVDSGGRSREVNGQAASVGHTEFASGSWLGIELEQACGKNDGTVSGVSYFDCAPRHGLFVKKYSSSVKRARAALDEERSRG